MKIRIEFKKHIVVISNFINASKFLVKKDAINFSKKKNWIELWWKRKMSNNMQTYSIANERSIFSCDKLCHKIIHI